MNSRQQHSLLEALDLLNGLPSDPDNSEDDADSSADEELQSVGNALNETSVSESGDPTTSRGGGGASQSTTSETSGGGSIAQLTTSAAGGGSSVVQLTTSRAGGGGSAAQPTTSGAGGGGCTAKLTTSGAGGGGSTVQLTILRAGAKRKAPQPAAKIKSSERCSTSQPSRGGGGCSDAGAQPKTLGAGGGGSAAQPTTSGAGGGGPAAKLTTSGAGRGVSAAQPTASGAGGGGSAAKLTTSGAGGGGSAAQPTTSAAGGGSAAKLTTSRAAMVGTAAARGAVYLDDTDDTDDAGAASDGTTENETTEEWSHNTTQFAQLPSNFESVPSVTIDVGNLRNESDYFSLIFTNELLQDIVDQTNMYANQPKNNVRNVGRRSRENAPNPARPRPWQDMTIVELRAWLGMQIIMGIHVLPELKNYWSSDPVLGVEAVSSVMTGKRFKKIVENIHLNDNTTIVPKDDPSYDKLHKVRPLVTKINDVVKEVYQPSKTLSVDESMIPFKGRSSMKQYMPMKPIKRGYKVWCVADSQTGYIVGFEIYSGKASIADQDTSLTLSERVVSKLTGVLSRTYSIVAFDNFFTTLHLMNMLFEQGIFAVGTVRANRKGLPMMLRAKDNLQRGEFMYQTKGCVAAIKWQDNKPVCFLTTAHSPTDVSVIQRKNKDGSKTDITCPNAVAQYNEIMGGVDRFDQLKERYAIGRRSIKWWHRILYYLIDLAIINSFILWKLNKRSSANHDQMSYRLRLARQLIDGFTTRKRIGRPISFLANKKEVPDDVRLAAVGQHMPTQGNTYRRCRMCSTRAHEQRTRFTCSFCSVPLCIDTCFAKFHGK
jgi:Transposase IS4